MKTSFIVKIRRKDGVTLHERTIKGSSDITSQQELSLTHVAGDVLKNLLSNSQITRGVSQIEFRIRLKK